MDNRSLSESFTELNDVIKSYVDARMRYWKLLLLEKSTRASTFLLSSVAVVMLLLSFLVFLCFSFSFWYGETHGPLWEGFLISAGFSLVLAVLFFLLRKWIFSRTIIRNLRKLIFSEEGEN